MTKKPVLAWHFVGIEAGRTYKHDGDLVLCEEGLHASIRALDALSYAAGPIVCRVSCGGNIIPDTDKLVCSRRKVLWMADATDTLMEFARKCALDVIHLWDAPEVVVKYLKTGDGSIRAASCAVTLAAARDVERDASWYAACAAVQAASCAACWDVVCNAARGASWDASHAVEEDAARAASRKKQNARLHKILMGLKPKQTETEKS